MVGAVVALCNGNRYLTGNRPVGIDVAVVYEGIPHIHFLSLRSSVPPLVFSELSPIIKKIYIFLSLIIRRHEDTGKTILYSVRIFRDLFQIKINLTNYSSYQSRNDFIALSSSRVCAKIVLENQTKIMPTLRLFQIIL